MDVLKSLISGSEELGLKLTEKQFEQLMELQNQLIKWTKVFNLTSITDKSDVLKLHLLDSLAIAPYWKNEQNQFTKTLDVGTGAGFPGLPLAIVCPELEFHLLDSNSKKIRFIRQQIHELGLKNVTAFHSRVQDHQIKDYPCIVSRAFASISDMVSMTEDLLTDTGSWMAMKGNYSEQEKNELPVTIQQTNFYPLRVPGLNAERCLVQLSRRKD